MCAVPLLLAYFAVVKPEVLAVSEPLVNEQQLQSIVHESAAGQRSWMSSSGKSERAAVSSQVDDCDVAEERSETIIKTKESQAAGAVFIASPAVTSRSECAAECCNSKSCNTAVVKEKGKDFGCYLFDCGSPNVCMFSAHAGYAVLLLSLSSHSASADRETDKHANELADLVSLPSVGLTTVSHVIPTQSTGKTLYASCQMDNECAPNLNLECLDGFCLCLQDYHIVGAFCRKDCNRFQFECINKNNPSEAECVAVYDRCNGIAQCRDESDEQQCADGHHQPQQQQQLPQPSSRLSETSEARKQLLDVNGKAPHSPGWISDTPSGLSSYYGNASRAIVSSGSGTQNRKQSSEVGSTSSSKGGDSVSNFYGLDPSAMSGVRTGASGLVREHSRHDIDTLVPGDIVDAQDQIVKDLGGQYSRGDELGQGVSDISSGSSNLARKMIENNYRNKLRADSSGSFDADKYVSSEKKPASPDKFGKSGSDRPEAVQRAPISRLSSSSGKLVQGGVDAGTRDDQVMGSDRFSVDRDRLVADGMVQVGSDARSIEKLQLDAKDRLTKPLSSGEVIRSGDSTIGGRRHDVGGSAQSFDNAKGLYSEADSRQMSGSVVRPDSGDWDRSNVRPADRSKVQKLDSLDILPSDRGRYGSAKGSLPPTNSVPVSGVGGGSLDRPSDSRISDVDLPSSVKTGLRGRLIGNSRVANLGPVDYSNEQYSDADEKTVQQYGKVPDISGSPSRGSPLDSVPAGRGKAVRVQEPSSLDSQPVKDADLYRYHENPVESMRLERIRPSSIDGSDSPLSGYGSNIAVDGIDRSGSAAYGYGSQYADDESLVGRYGDPGQLVPASSYDGDRVPGGMSSQPIGQTQYYRYGGRDGYGDSTYSADDYYYGGGGMPWRKQSPRSYHRAGGTSGAVGGTDYDYYSAAADTGLPSSGRRKTARVNANSREGDPIRKSDGVLTGSARAASNHAVTEKTVNKLRPTVSALVKISPRNETSLQQIVATTVATTTHAASTTSSTKASVSLSAVAPTSNNKVASTTENPSSTSSSKVSTNNSRKHGSKLSSSTDSAHRSAAAGGGGGTDALTRSDSAFWSTPGIHGAVAALSLGIMITATLLVYAGCRFRRIRKLSLRRYRPVGNNDADYLVNGMYL